MNLNILIKFFLNVILIKIFTLNITGRCFDMSRFFNKKEIELLAPAGTFEIFEKVIKSGADAVYFGGKKLNMRMHRKDYNLSNDEIEKAISIAHSLNKKVYVTVNNLLSHKDLKDAEEYLIDRAKRRFNVILGVALAECDGLRTENAYGSFSLLKNEAGDYDPTMPDLAGDYSYWDHIDYVIDKANELGLYIGFLPTWGDKFNLYWGKGPVIFNSENARAYGQWLGERYKNKTNKITSILTIFIVFFIYSTP